MMDDVIEDVFECVLMIAIGAPVVVVALARGETFGRATTICLAMVVLGLRGLARCRQTVPRVRVVPHQRWVRRR
jgi:hypothetical protein